MSLVTLHCKFVILSHCRGPYGLRSQSLEEFGEEDASDEWCAEPGRWHQSRHETVRPRVALIGNWAFTGTLNC